ncbi:MAG: MG2 domain-containing protein, partial [Moraxellaceae bacterium]|nr:MG2 domain-containing protein [Moraxellaceae bacterium]
MTATRSLARRVAVFFNAPPLLNVLSAKAPLLAGLCVTALLLPLGAAAAAPASAATSGSTSTATSAQAKTAPGVVLFAPQGELATVRQVTARFATDMVRLGDPKVKNPFTVSCVAPGKGRWIDTRNWAYDFVKDVPRNHSCTFTLVQDQRDVAGKPLTGKRHFAFNTSPLAEAPPAAQAGEVKVDFFTPTGEASQVRQVQTRFSEAMIRLGDGRVYNPFAVNCAVPGKGRWVDTRNWVYDFERELPSGITCEFRRVKDLRGVSGSPLGGQVLYRFNTGGPTVFDARPYRSHDGIDENQTFLFKFDGENDVKSLPASTYCLIGDLKEKIPLRWLTGEQTRAFVAGLPKEYRDWWSARGRVQEWRAVQCARQFPPGADVKIVIGKGLLSKTGVARSSDQVLEYHVRQAFSATFRCTRESARKGCAPMTDMYLEFSDLVSAELLKSIRLEGAGKAWMPLPNAGDGGDYDEYGGDSGLGPDDFVPGQRVTFRGPFPPETSFILRLPAGFKDESGRVLTNAVRFPLALTTAAYPPLAKFAADFGIIEKAAGAVPLTVRNLEGGLPKATAGTVQSEARLFSYRLPDNDLELLKWLQRFHKHVDKQSCYNCSQYDEKGRVIDIDPRSLSLLAKQPGATVQTLPRALPAKEFEVIGIPVRASGVYLHEVESRYLGASLMDKPAPMYVPAMSLVTNLGVHFRYGREQAQVWVTTLDKAKPVPNADVALYDCKSRQVFWRGVTDARGVAEMPTPPSVSSWGECRSSHAVIVRSEGDMSLVLPGWDEGIESWRFDLPGWRQSGSLIGHSILDRTLLRAGETVHARHVLREAALTGLRGPATLKDAKLLIQHQGSGQQYELPLDIDAGGNGESAWTIPVAAKLGQYELQLRTKADHLTLARFRVEEFRLPVLKPRLQLPTGILVQPATVPVDMQLSYLNGGGYANAAITLRGRVSQSGVNVPGFDDYAFGDQSADSGEEGDYDGSPVMLEEKTLNLDANGGGRTDSATLPEIKRISRVQMEMEFRDPSGENQTVSSQTTVWPADVLPGIRLPSWVSLAGKTPQPVDIITVGPDFKPRGNVPVRVTAELHTEQTHRKRTVGGFYSYDTVTKKEAVPMNCAGRTNADGRLQCTVQPTVSGNLVLRVTATDSAQRKISASTSTWVSSGDRWWFSQDNNDRIDLLPEEKEYRSGETMRFQVRMPFPTATALVSIERDGVIDSRVLELDAKNPVIELPVKPEYAPNVFVSAFLVRGRHAEVAPTALIDLGKPAFKLGIANVKVDWAASRLGVVVSTDKPRYAPRANARVSVQVTPPAGQRLPAGTEVVLAAVDEALLELAGNNTFDVLTPMMDARGHGMNTSTSQLQVVGKRHYGRKALPSGGGGGAGGGTRELFDTLLYWQARGTVDANGRAEFTVPLNDSLTGFRLLAAAVAEERFGQGQTRMESFQDLQLVSGLPLLVRQGDRLDPGFTLRNASAKPLSVQFRASIDGLGTVLERGLTLAPGASEVVTVPFTVPADINELRWHVSAEGREASDALRLTQKVLDPVPEQIWQATLLQLDAPTDIPVQKPAGALSGGALVVSGQARLADSLGSVREYFRHYPYSCLEQK